MAERVYFLGIGGTLMAGLALLSKALGYETYGSDGVIYPPMSTQLGKAEIPVFEGFSKDHLDPEPYAVVVGNANLHRGVESVEVILERKLNYTSSAEWLSDTVLRQRHVIGVSGTHGKSSTTAMVAHILDTCGIDCGYLIGGVPRNFNVSARLGTARPFIVEADEYDTSYFDRRSKFVHYRPDILIINNLEFDHADIFANLEEIELQFHNLIRSIPRNGRILVPFKYPSIHKVIDQGCWTPLSYVHVEPSEVESERLQQLLDTGADVWTAHLQSHDGTSFEVAHNFGNVVEVVWNQFGLYSVNNALFAIAAAVEEGVPVEAAAKALSSFTGVKRRMEKFVETEDIVVYDDFAHHPSAIRETLQGLRDHIGTERILAVIEPRTHTMSLGTHQTELRKCCSAANEVIWYKDENVEMDVSSLADESIVPSRVMYDVQSIVDSVCVQPAERTHVVIMSNGAFGGIYAQVEERLSRTPIVSIAGA